MNNRIRDMLTKPDKKKAPRKITGIANELMDGFKDMVANGSIDDAALDRLTEPMWTCFGLKISEERGGEIRITGGYKTNDEALADLDDKTVGYPHARTFNLVSPGVPHVIGGWMIEAGLPEHLLDDLISQVASCVASVLIERVKEGE